MSGPVIDTHHHYLPTTLLEAFRRRSEPPCSVQVESLINSFAPGGVSGAGEAVRFGQDHVFGVTDELVDLDLHLHHMDEHSIDIAVLSSNTPGVDLFDAADAIAVARDCNDEMAEKCAAGGGRFVGLATLPMQAPEAAAAELERAVGLGFLGAQVLSNINGDDIHDDRFRPVFDMAGELNTTVRLHPTARNAQWGVSRYSLLTAVGYVCDTTTAGLGLVYSGVYQRYPDFKLVIPHIGGVLPYLIARVDYEAERLASRGGAGVLDERPSEYVKRIYTDTACSAQPALLMAMDVFGHDHVMLGTDYPYWDTPTSMSVFDGLAVTDEELLDINTRAAQRLFGGALAPAVA
jgi:aminocarboxymuconate-semialdehyde decarboxylase